MNLPSKFIFLAVVLLTASPVLAQFETAEVLGTVHDNSGAVMVGANVTLINQDTGIQAKTTTDSIGNYEFFNVRVGRYTITAEAPGFTKFTAKDVVVNVNARQRVDITLQVGVVSETVEVQGAAAVLQTDSSEHGQIIKTQQIVDLPLNGRNYSDLALLTTNVHKSPIAMTESTPREGAFNVNGMRSTYNNFLLDGLDNNAYSTSNQGFSEPSGAALAGRRGRVQGHHQQLQRGVWPVGGAVVNVVMRSGTNQIHGTAFEFLRNTDFNAVGFFRPTMGSNRRCNATSSAQPWVGRSSEQGFLLRRL